MGPHRAVGRIPSRRERARDVSIWAESDHDVRFHAGLLEHETPAADLAHGGEHATVRYLGVGTSAAVGLGSVWNAGDRCRLHMATDTLARKRGAGGDLDGHKLRLLRQACLSDR